MQNVANVVKDSKWNDLSVWSACSSALIFLVMEKQHLTALSVCNAFCRWVARSKTNYRNGLWLCRLSFKACTDIYFNALTPLIRGKCTVNACLVWRSIFAEAFICQNIGI